MYIRLEIFVKDPSVTLLVMTSDFLTISSMIYFVCDDIGLGPSQDVHFFYTLSHLSAPKSCALIFSTNFQSIFTFK